MGVPGQGTPHDSAFGSLMRPFAGSGARRPRAAPTTVPLGASANAPGAPVLAQVLEMAAGGQLEEPVTVGVRDEQIARPVDGELVGFVKSHFPAGLQNTLPQRRADRSPATQWTRPPGVSRTTLLAAM